MQTKLEMGSGTGYSGQKWGGPGSKFGARGAENGDFRKKGLITPVFVKWANQLIESARSDELVIQGHTLDQVFHFWRPLSPVVQCRGEACERGLKCADTHCSHN
jgi:hypothetical protein